MVRTGRGGKSSRLCSLSLCVRARNSGRIWALFVLTRPDTRLAFQAQSGRLAVAVGGKPGTLPARQMAWTPVALIAVCAVAPLILLAALILFRLWLMNNRHALLCETHHQAQREIDGLHGRSYGRGQKTQKSPWKQLIGTQLFRDWDPGCVTTACSARSNSTSSTRRWPRRIKKYLAATGPHDAHDERAWTLRHHD